MFLSAPSSYETIEKRGWMREGVAEGGGTGTGADGEDRSSAGVRKGRVVAAAGSGPECVLAWEETRLDASWSERCVFVVSRNGDSSVTIRSVSGVCVCMCARAHARVRACDSWVSIRSTSGSLLAGQGGGHAQRRAYLEVRGRVKFSIKNRANGY